MWKSFFAFDLRYHLRQPLLWISTLPLVLISFLSASSDSFRIGGAIGNAHMNAPVVIVNQLGVLSIIAMFLVTVFLAGAILRDSEVGMADLLFATPMRKFDYLLGRFLAGFATCLLVFGLITVAMMIGSRMPGIDPARIGPFSLQSYAWGFFVYVVPNLLFVSALLTLLAATTRSMMMVYVGVLGFVALWSIAGFLGGRADSAVLAVLLDPFGVRVLAQATRYFTSADMNVRLPELSGALLMNRALWTMLALGMFGTTLVLFKPLRVGTGRGWRKRRAVLEVAASAAPSTPLRRIEPIFGAATAWHQTARLLRADVRAVLRSLPFLVMLLLALANFFANYTIGGMRFDSTPYPLTRLMLEELAGGLNEMLVIVLIFFSGELVYKDRQARIDGLADALPVPNWAPLLAKCGALVAIVLAFLLAGVVAAVGIQLVVGGAPVDVILYAKGTLISSAYFVLMAMALLALQVVAGNKFLGYALGIAVLASGPVLRGLRIEHHLSNFASLPTLRYSDMNGYGHYIAGWAWFVLYWGLLAAAMLIAAQGFWVRGTAPRWGERVKAAAAALRGRAGAALALCLSGFAAAGGWIYYNTNILNDYQSSEALLDFRAGYEKAYRKDMDLPLPSLTGIRAEVDIFPSEHVLRIHGHYVLQNKTQAPLAVLRIQNDLRATTHFDKLPAGRLVRDDARYGVQDWQLDQPLAPGASIALDFTVDVRRHGFTNDGMPDPVNDNGTLFAFEDYFPKFGYNQSLEIDDAKARKARGLGEAHRMPKLEDGQAQYKNYWKLFGIDADFIDFETTVSTSADQTALAPGSLVNSWEKDGRRYFHYKMDRPILPFFGYQSARWEVKRDQWSGLPIEVYYDTKHAYNIDRMIAGAKGALDYYTANFGPYPYKQVRIVETPLYQSYARAFPTLTPFSESLGFISDLRDPAAADHVFYVTAHELAHQWWGDQAIAANVQGGGLVTESLAEYSALMAVEKHYGAETVRRILRFDLDEYLRGRTAEGAEEQPLIRNESQTYLQYRKASLVFYRLREEIGEAAVNRALRRFLDDKRYQTTPYTTSRDLLGYLRAETPASKQDLVTDLFERIVFYDNRVLAAKASPRADGRWDVSVTVRLAKTEADGHGKETARVYDEPIDIAVFTGGRLLPAAQRVLPAGETRFTLTVAEKPSEVCIDPRQLLIDRVPADNRRAVDIAN
ncbi:M1 family aminopeptidase [Polyangium sp. 15x6]|uniref:M1 family aminopeptidase n=1 Tax=Polyangium sp. 15x6 TaxID=3042687 RepID=UPI00249C0900|nr:M1 family aminopeptidase [Polyangium sp. 15x6]MDI3290651.1 M1 family aminopeptidase [Polyangium sp. 15x6]